MDTLHDDLIRQFKEITGSTEDVQIRNLLTVHGWNLNNCISTFFDSGFDQIANREVSTSLASLDTAAISSGVEAFESVSAPDADVVHRRESRSSAVNLQSQLFFDNYIPKLPKAPRISSQWSLEVGLNVSLKHEQQRTLIEKTDAGVSETPSVAADVGNGGTLALWIVLLFIPKSLLTILVSIFKFLFGSTFKRRALLHNFPRQFSYDEYDPAEETTFDLIKAERDSGQPLINTHSFNEVHSRAQTQYTWLLVVLTDSEPQVEAFARHFFSHPALMQLADTEVYANNVSTSREAYEVGKTYRVKKVPHVMLIANVTNNPLVMSSMSIVYKLNVALQSIESEDAIEHTVRKVYRALHKVIEHFNPQLITQRIDRQEIEFSRMIKEQQDAAYVESLSRDKIKRQEKDQQQEWARQQAQLAATRRTFLLRLLQKQERLDAASGVKIAIKLPHGGRLVEQFAPLTTATQLYLFVEVQLFVHELVASTADDDSEIEDENDVMMRARELSPDAPVLSAAEYVTQFPFKFELIQPFPKKVIEAADVAITEVPELKNGGSLLVEYVEDDQETEELQ